ncbi:diguanylate cyclase domain-containing protein [Chlorogloeopsis fritschii]|uniref:diguanylate cyclase domain-containing protein n=1 Tax=Chlorogloeopsis fritschii TaxID=1124 RepID=UPI00370DDE0D
MSNASLTILLLGIAVGIRQPILQRFAALEQNLMQKKLARVADVFVQRVEKLDSSAKAEATWTEMYIYMKERDRTFYQDTYPFEGLMNSAYDVLGILDRKDNPIHLDWIDWRSQQIKPLPNTIRDDLLRERLLTRFPADDDPALGSSRNLAVVQTSTELLLVAARPILTGDAKGPRRGTLLMGVFITQEFLDQLEKYSDLQLQLAPLSSEQPLTQRSAKHNLSDIAYMSDIVKISPHIRVLNNRWITGEIYLLNSDRQPIQILSVRSPRLEYQQGEATLNQLTGVLFVVGISLGIIISLLLDRAIRNQQLLKISETTLQAANQELQKLANLDGLTQIANRRYFEQVLQQEWTQAICEQYPLTLILCDVDYFKRFNDTYGHLKGDECLAQVAQAICRAVRQPGDFVARYGGEEFAIVLPHTDLQGGLWVAKAIQQQVQNLRIEHTGSPISAYVSVSLGISSLVPEQGTAPEILIEQSDQKLYSAKQQGRNQIVFY